MAISYSNPYQNVTIPANSTESTKTGSGVRTTHKASSGITHGGGNESGGSGTTHGGGGGKFSDNSAQLGTLNSYGRSFRINQIRIFDAFNNSKLNDEGYSLLDIKTNSNNNYVCTVLGPDGNAYSVVLDAPMYTYGDNGKHAFVDTEVKNPDYEDAHPTPGTVTEKDLFNALYDDAFLQDAFNPNSANFALGNTYNNIKTSLAEQEQAAQDEARAKQSNAAIGILLDKVNNMGYANAGRTFTADDYKALSALFPKASDAQITNMIASSDPYAVLANYLSDPDREDNIDTATLQDYLQLAGVLNSTARTRTDNTIQQQRNAALKQIANDEELYANLISQLRSDAASGVAAGHRAANVGDVAKKANASYSDIAKTLYESLASGENSQADNIRQTLYNNSIGAYQNYTAQQIALALEAANKFSQQSADFQSVLDAYQQALAAESYKMQRNAADEKARIENEATVRASQVAAQAQADNANASANADLLSQYGQLISNYTGGTNTAAALDTLKNNINNTSAVSQGGTSVTPEYIKNPYIDETVYNALVNNSTYAKYLSPERLSYFLQDKKYADVAKENGIDYLMDAYGLSNLYAQAAEEANKESDKVFNAAQKAYLAAVAAGDTQTIAQLTGVAATAGASRGNLYGTSALANQFSQQRRNATIGNTLLQDQINQQTANLDALVRAKQQGLSDRVNYLGNGTGSSPSGLLGATSLYNSVSGSNRSKYSDIAGETMLSQAEQNDIISTLGNAANSARAQLASTYNSANGAAAATNANVDATRKGLTTALNTSKTSNNTVIKKATK